MKRHCTTSDENHHLRSHFLSPVAAFVVRKVVLLNRQEPRRRISAIPFALCGRSGANATFETLTRIRSRTEWVEVWTDVSALDGAIHQPLNRSFNEIAGCFKQLRGASDERIRGWGDDLLRQQVDEPPSRVDSTTRACIESS